MNTTAEKRIEEAAALAFEYERDERGCGQSTLKALMNAYDKTEGDIYQAFTGFSGGSGCLGDGQCGAYSAGIFFIGMFYGRRLEHMGTNPDDIRGSQINSVNFELVEKLHNRFINEYGSVTCHQIHRKLFGRPFYLRDEGDKIKFDKAGAHKFGCTSVCGNAARWAALIIEKAQTIIL